MQKRASDVVLRSLRCRANAKPIFFDNVYMYGKVTVPMTEETPFNPSSGKGEIRAQIARMLLDEIKVFDSSKFTKAFRFEPVDYGAGIEQRRST